MENSENKMHQVDIVRPVQVNLWLNLHWLMWLTTPIRFLWRLLTRPVLVWASLVVVAWNGMKTAVNTRYYKVAVTAGILMALIQWIFFFIAALMDRFEVSIGMAITGVILANLPLAWGLGEITSLIDSENSDNAESLPALKHRHNGMEVVKNILLYVIIIIVMIFIQVDIDLLAKIPDIGPSFLSLLLFPNVLSSAIILLSVILLLYSLAILPSHLLHVEENVRQTFLRKFYRVSQSIFGLLTTNWMWLKILLISPFVGFFGVLISVPLFLLIGGSIGISALTALIVGVGEVFVIILGPILSLLSLPISMFAFKSILVELTTEYKVAVFISGISICGILGVGLCLLITNYASTYYLLYKKTKV